jgi:hypothetical protein
MNKKKENDDNERVLGSFQLLCSGLMLEREETIARVLTPPFRLFVLEAARKDARPRDLYEGSLLVENYVTYSATLLLEYA